jgi:integrase
MADCSITEITEAYMEFREHRYAEKTLEVDRKACAALLGMDVDRVSDLTIRHADRYVERRYGEGMSPRTINMELGGIKRIIKWAIPREMCEETKTLTFFLEKKPQDDHGVREKRAFTIEEVHELMPRIPEQWRTLMHLYLLTGVRRAEGLFLTWAEVDLKAEVIKLSDVRTKTRTARKVYLGPRMLSLLSKMEQIGEYVFPNPETGKPHDISSPGKVMKAAAKRAGWSDLGGVSPHRWRYTFITVALENGMERQDVSKLAGHEGVITDNYYKPSDKHMCEKAKMVEEWILGEEK